MKNYILIAIVITMFSLAFMFRPSKYKAPQYNPVGQISQVQSEVNFWMDKLSLDPGNPSYMIKYADACSELFEITSDIDALYRSEANYRKASSKLNEENIDLLQKLAHLSIKKHDFKGAHKFLIQALNLNENDHSVKLMLYDVFSELGMYEDAEKILLSVDDQGFQYLIRSAKWHDHHNRLDSAIYQLELARNVAEESNNEKYLTWIHSNLGDFYGHAGQLDKSKQSFEKALALNSADWYSYKGLARIAWAANDFSEKALEMLNQILLHNNSPSILLLKADILEHLGDIKQADGLREMVHYTTTKNVYGNMYNAFNFEYHLNKNELSLARSYAEKELKVRETPNAYLLQSLIEYHSNNQNLAEKIVKEKILPNTFEPNILAEILPVIKSDTGVHKKILNELKEAEFELGPLTYASLKE